MRILSSHHHRLTHQHQIKCNKMKRNLTWADLENNPQLQLDGLKVGDEVEIPDPEETENDKNADTQTAAATADGDTDTGGSAPPPDKPRDD